MNMKFLFFALVLFFSPLVLSAQPTICTITINSAEEREVLKELYGNSANIHELVPEGNRDPHWLQKACQSQVQCDSLLISGHFGGVFFGEGHSTTLDLREIEKRSCDNSCPGIFSKPKDVFLMGCNTLSTKTPDKRSTEEYVEVLLQNGFPRDLAERVAFARYSNYGMSIGQLFASAFPNAERLHGFTSTSPLGKVAGPQLKRALSKTSATQFFQTGPDTKALSQVFTGLGFRIVEPRKEIDPTYRQLSCGSLSQESKELENAVLILSKKENLEKYYEPILNSMGNSQFMGLLKSAVTKSQSTRMHFLEFFSSIEKAKSLPLKMQIQVYQFKEKMGLISSQDLMDLKIKSLRSRLSKKVDFIVTDQICSMKNEIADVELRHAWLSNQNGELAHFLPRMASCFGRYDDEVFLTLYRLGTNHDPTVRREALRALAPKLSKDDKDFFQLVSDDWNLRDQMDLAYTINAIPPLQSLNSRMHSCLATARRGDSAPSRDGYRWHCYNSLEAEIDTPLKCHQVAREFETESGSGLAWSCLTRFNDNIHLGSCLESANMIADAENSDDVRWYCWSKLHERKSLSRSECLALASSMRVQGNQFKANWNCMNRVRY
ncbi:hypothetical protein BDW_00375 [Bdellovibrio bacteriovorus W]|nr:hypothetical protein BDW_00375 [Bdellovibrio bacteriovorus W]